MKTATGRSQQRRRSRARHSRGAVYVESIVVSMMLVLLLGGIFFFHKLYAGKLFAMREARAQAWQEAFGGECQGAATGAAMNLVEAAWNNDAHDVCSGVSGNDCESGSAVGMNMSYDQSPPGWEIGEGNGEQQVAVATRGTGVGALTPNWSGTVRARLAVPCDETPQTGDKTNMPDVVLYAAGLFFEDHPFED
jgi:hypothetical protein